MFISRLLLISMLFVVFGVIEIVGKIVRWAEEGSALTAGAPTV